MGEWKKTACVLCAQNCGLEVLVADDRMVKAQPDAAPHKRPETFCFQLFG